MCCSQPGTSSESRWRFANRTPTTRPCSRLRSRSAAARTSAWSRHCLSAQRCRRPRSPDSCAAWPSTLPITRMSISVPGSPRTAWRRCWTRCRSCRRRSTGHGWRWGRTNAPAHAASPAVALIASPSAAGSTRCRPRPSPMSSTRWRPAPPAVTRSPWRPGCSPCSHISAMSAGWKHFRTRQAAGSRLQRYA